MYKNFKLTDDERKEIMEAHKSHGYKKPINELGDDEIGIIRGKPNLKRKIGRPSREYADDSKAANQFQQDFKSEFPDPGIEDVPFWEKDQAMPSADSEKDTLIRGDYKDGNSYKSPQKQYEKPKEIDVFQKYQKFTQKEELDSLERKIIFLRGEKEKFGLDERLDGVYRDLLAKYREMSERS
jgi:hypothetical protein